MLENTQEKQAQDSENTYEIHNHTKMWFIPENCVGLNVNEKYDLINKLAEDSLSVTYLVKQYLHNPSLGRFYQIKLYKPEIMSESWIKEGIFEQIKNDLALNSRLILSCYEYNEWNEIPFTVHDFFEWKSLEEIICEKENNSVSSKFAVSCAIEILKSLESLYASPSEFKHSSRFIHGNLTPNKILISQDTGTVLLSDPGMIGLYSRACLNHSMPISIETKYSSPEQINREPITIASDIFSVGLILLDILTPAYREKMKSFSAEEAYEFLNEKLCETLTSFKLNDEIIKILSKALHPNENERYQTPALFNADLNAYLRKQYWVFDIQENIKTIFYVQKESEKSEQTQSEFNKTLILSTPKELVNSLPLEELTQEIEVITLPVITLPEVVIQNTNRTTTLHRFSPPVISTKKKSNALNKKLMIILSASAVILFSLVCFFKQRQHTQQLENLDAGVARPLVSEKSISVQKITPSKETKSHSNKEIIAKEKHAKLTKQINSNETTTQISSHSAPATIRVNKDFSSISINAVPFATIDIPAARIASQITPLSHIKLPVGKSIVILIHHGNCSLKKEINTEEKENFELRFNMFNCKEY